MVHTGNVEEVFTYHAPTPAQVDVLQRIRADAMTLVRTALESVPSCADQQAGIRKIREGVMTLNAAVVLEGRI